MDRHRHPLLNRARACAASDVDRRSVLFAEPFRDRNDSSGDGSIFATRRFTHLQPNQFFGIAFWIGFSINTIIVEMSLRAGNHISIPTQNILEIRFNSILIGTNQARALRLTFS